MKLNEFITLDKKKYEELSDMAKDRLDLFVKKLIEAGLDKKIEQYPLYTYDITRETANGSVEFKHTTNLPKDLATKMDYVWHTLYH